MTATAPAAPVYVDQNWHEEDTAAFDGARQYRATDDPRLLAIIERSSDSMTPDGDAYAPAYSADYRGGWSLDRIGSGFDDDEAAEAVVTAWSHWGVNSDTAERFLRIFHGVTVHTLSGPSQGDLLVILDTPAHREHTGGSGTSDEYTKGDRDAWRAYRDGDVWAIGYAVNPLRTTHDEPVDLDDWTVEIESYGYYGEDWAREAALGLDGGPTAVELDAMTEAARTAELDAAVRAAAPALVRESLDALDAVTAAWNDEHGDDGDASASEWSAYDEKRVTLLYAIADAVRPLVGK